MAYALAGIPLMLLYMASVGDILASAFRYAYFNFLCRGAGRRRKPPRRRGGSSRSTRRGRLDCDSGDSDSDYLECGVASSAVFEMSLEAAEGVRGVARRRGGSGRSSSKSEKQIPVWACLSVIAGFVAGGATLFSAWEGWPLLDAAYFCVVSLVTVGFGDLVPGDAFRGAETTEVGGAGPKALDGTGASSAAVGIAAKEALSSAPVGGPTFGPAASGTTRRLLDMDNYLYIDDEYADLMTTSGPITPHPNEDLTPAFGGVFSDYVTTKDMMMVDGKLTFCALYLLTGMALLAMNFHLMQETGLRAARKVLDRLRPSWGESKGGTRERSIPATVGAIFHPGTPQTWSKGEAWRRRTWAGEGRRFARGQEQFGRRRRGSWAEVGTEQWESGAEGDGLETSRPENGGGSGGTVGGGVIITLQADDGAVYDWKPGGVGSLEYEYSMEDYKGTDTGEGERVEIDYKGSEDKVKEDLKRRKPKTLSNRSTGSHRSRTSIMDQSPEERTIAASFRTVTRLEVPPKIPANQNMATLRRLQRSRSLGPEASSSVSRVSPSRHSLDEAAGKEWGREAEKGSRKYGKGKKSSISAWRKRRKRKKGLRRVGGTAARQSGFRNPFFSTSSLDRIPSDCR